MFVCQVVCLIDCHNDYKNKKQYDCTFQLNNNHDEVHPGSVITLGFTSNNNNNNKMSRGFFWFMKYVTFTGKFSAFIKILKNKPFQLPFLL